MIAIEADFNHLDGRGRLILADLRIHERTPFAEIAEAGERILFVDSGECVEGRLEKDPNNGWVGAANWDSLDTLRAYPSDRPVLTHAGGG